MVIAAGGIVPPYHCAMMAFVETNETNPVQSTIQLSNQFYFNFTIMISLQNKNAVIYGAGGSLGGAMAKAFAAAGARVFLSGIHLDKVQKVADDINAAGGDAEAAEVDA